MTTREERKNIRQAILLISLAILSILFLFYVGIPLVAKFTAYLNSIRETSNDISNDNTPPAPPKFDSFSDYTNQKKFDIKGTAEPGSTIKLTFNGEEKENITGRDGNFSFNVDLNSSTNSFSAIAIDQAGNKSQETKEYKITFDEKPPELSVTKPENGASMFGVTQRQLTIEGTTDPETNITINDRFVTVADDGNFQFTTTMSEGENTYNVKATDQAGNITEKSLSVSFTP